MSKKNTAVKVDGLVKTFHIPLESHSGIKQKLINTLKGHKGYREFTPLKGVSFEIEEGDFFGIVGRNGSGKSTLLKTLAGIYEPNNGAVHINGTLVPFIELGVGFNPELTGRENVFLNGALLGFSHSQMELMYSDIVEFAELHEFMEERLKNYSSGMQVRLAFSIAIRAEAHVLLLDEVLAVGDEAFQRKCYAYFDELKRKKKTVVLVTHDMASVERFCTRALFLEDGEVKLLGRPKDVATAYSKSNDSSYEEGLERDQEAQVKKNQPKSKIKVSTTEMTNRPKKRFSSGETMRVKVEWPYDTVNYVGVAINTKDDVFVFGPNTYQDKTPLDLARKKITYEVELPLAKGDYYLSVGLFGRDDVDRIDFLTDGPAIIVDKNYNEEWWGGVTKLAYKWRQDD